MEHMGLSNAPNAPYINAIINMIDHAIITTYSVTGEINNKEWLGIVHKKIAFKEYYAN